MSVLPDAMHILYTNIAHKGHGFKLGPLVGKLIAEMTLGQIPSFDMTPFRIERFNTETELKS